VQAEHPAIYFPPVRCTLLILDLGLLCPPSEKRSVIELRLKRWLATQPKIGSLHFIQCYSEVPGRKKACLKVNFENSWKSAGLVRRQKVSKERGRPLKLNVFLFLFFSSLGIHPASTRSVVIALFLLGNLKVCTHRRPTASLRNWLARQASILDRSSICS